MKLQHCLALGLTLICSANLSAQSDKLLDDVPLEVRTADRLTDVQKQEVQQYINGWVGEMADGSNPSQQGQARDKLTTGANAVGTETASADYQSQYAGTMNDALLPLTKNADMRTRLLAGVVAGRVAERMNNARLEPVAVALLNDKSDAVVLWGMRTARYVLPWILQNPMQKSALPDAMANALLNHPRIPIANDAYEGANLPPQTSGPTLLAAAQQVIHMLHARVQVYEKTCPVDPSADATGTTFLSSTAWSVLPAGQRLDSAQQISDLMSVMAQRCLADGPSSFPRIIAGLQPVAAAVFVIGNADQAPGVVNAARPVALQHFQANTPPQDILTLVQKVYPALVSVPEFSKLQAPPKVVVAPTTRP
jgi:hypothetical protein